MSACKQKTDWETFQCVNFPFLEELLLQVAWCGVVWRGVAWRGIV